MSSTAPRGPAPDVPASHVRPLPSRPNLEYERKQAKKLLQQIHQGDPEAWQRARAQLRDLTPAAPDEFRLSDAQFAIAREYGFASWPRLVEYYTTLERHERSGARRRRRWCRSAAEPYAPVRSRGPGRRPYGAVRNCSHRRRSGPST